MNFTQDFRADFEQFDFRSQQPWAFARFGDGEAAILQRKEVKAADGWDVHVSEEVRDALFQSLVFGCRDYHVGIACGSCDRASHSWLRNAIQDHCNTLERILLPERLTISDIFVNANFDAFKRKTDGLKVRVVGSSPKCQFRVHPQLINQPDCLSIIDQLVDDLCNQQDECPIFLAAGPASCIIAHRYWRTATSHTICCDIGSTLDPYLHGRYTRGYHDPSHPNRRKVCRWT